MAVPLLPETLNKRYGQIFMKTIFKSIASIIASVCISSSIFSGSHELKDITTQLYGADPWIQNDDDLLNLDKIILNAQVVGLGENTHGTREYFQMKHRILKYLVQNKGFNIFAIEAPMPNAYRLNDYVLYGKGDPKYLIKNIGYDWVWSTQEILDMVEWMREYNQTVKNKIQFVGFDLPLKPEVSARIVYDDLVKMGKNLEAEKVNQIVVDSVLLKNKYMEWIAVLFELMMKSDEIDSQLGKRLEELRKKHLPKEIYEKQVAELRAQRDVEIKILEDQYNPQLKAIQNDAQKEALILDERTQEIMKIIEQNGEHEWTLQNLRLLQELFDYYGLIVERDKSMADNALWILNRNPGSKLVLWGHSWHLRHSHEKNMGRFLSDSLGNKYRTFAFLTYEGKYRARNGYNNDPVEEFEMQTPPEDAFEFMLSQFEVPALLIDFSDKQNVPEFLQKEVLIRCPIGAGAIPKEMQFACPKYDIVHYFDGMIYLKTTSGTVPF